MDFPQWATPERRVHLVNLFNRSKGFCVFGHAKCPYPDHHYEGFIEGLIADWKAEDRERRQAEWRALERALHSLAEVKPERGEWNATGKDAFYALQPQYYIEGLGISGLTFRPFAKVRVSSTPVRLFVEIGEAVKGVSKNRRRKARRYGKALPPEAQERVDNAAWRAVKHYLG